MERIPPGVRSFFCGCGDLIPLAPTVNHGEPFPMSATATTSTTTLEAIANLQQLAELFLERRRQLARSVGLTVEEWRALEQISEEHFMPSMFAQERSSSKAAVSKILRQLQEKGFVEFSVPDENRRRRDYTLTSAGAATMSQLRANREAAIREVWGGLAQEELDHFICLTGELVKRLDRYTREKEH